MCTQTDVCKREGAFSDTHRWYWSLLKSHANHFIVYVRNSNLIAESRIYHAFFLSWKTKITFHRGLIMIKAHNIFRLLNFDYEKKNCEFPEIGLSMTRKKVALLGVWYAKFLQWYLKGLAYFNYILLTSLFNFVSLFTFNWNCFKIWIVCTRAFLRLNKCSGFIMCMYDMPNWLSQGVEKNHKTEIYIYCKDFFFFFFLWLPLISQKLYDVVCFCCSFYSDQR